MAGRKIERLTPGCLDAAKVEAIRQRRPDLLAACDQLFPAVVFRHSRRGARPLRKKPAAAPPVRATELPRGVESRKDLIAQLAGRH